MQDFRLLDTILSKFKINNGYNLSEIMNKSRSLKGVLEPFTSKANEDYLKRAGFQILKLYSNLLFSRLVCYKIVFKHPHIF